MASCSVLRHFVILSFYMCFYRKTASRNMKVKLKSWMFTLLGLVLPILALVNFLAGSSSRDMLDSLLGKSSTASLHLYLVIYPLVTFG